MHCFIRFSCTSCTRRSTFGCFLSVKRMKTIVFCCFRVVVWDVKRLVHGNQISLINVRCRQWASLWTFSAPPSSPHKSKLSLPGAAPGGPARGNAGSGLYGATNLIRTLFKLNTSHTLAFTSLYHPTATFYGSQTSPNSNHLHSNVLPLT